MDNIGVNNFESHDQYISENHLDNITMFLLSGHLNLVCVYQGDFGML